MEDKRRDVIVLSSTQVGKSVADALWLTREVWERPDPVMPYWWVAPVASQAVVGFRYMTRLALSAGILSQAPTISPFPMLRYINGGIVEFRSWERPENLMGSPIKGGVVDEAGLLDGESHGAVSSRRSSSMGPLRYSGNPGPFSGTFRRLCALAEDPANAKDFALYRWTWRDKYAWLATVNPPAAEDYRRFIEMQRESVKPEAEFLRLYEAEWTADESAVFRVVPRDGPPLMAAEQGHEYVIGVDVGQQIDFLVAAIACRQCRKLVAFERWRGIPYPQSAGRLEDISASWNGAPLVIEINGPGLGVFQDLQQRGRTPLFPFTTSGPSKQEIIVSLAAQLERDEATRLKVADVAPVQSELAAYRYERMPSGNYRYSAPEGEHDDCVIASALANYGLTHIPSADLSGYGWVS